MNNKIEQLLSDAAIKDAVEASLAQLGLVEKNEIGMQKNMSSRLRDLHPDSNIEKTEEDAAPDGDDGVSIVAKEKMKPRELDNLSLKSVVRTLNILRSGRSLRNKDILSNIKEYFNSLTDSEKRSMMAFLVALSDIMSKGEEGDEVPSPSDTPFDVQMKRKDSDSPPPKSSKARNSKDSSRKGSDKSVPIVVGESKTRRS